MCRRSVVKTVSWRIIATMLTAIIVWIISGSVALAGSITFADLISKSAAYYVHERIWAHVSWGVRTG
ncbi:MAG: hypothetical protein DRO96_02140 [Candidatus Aenigmatarchaeota archaeon]|nr:MAG: hypothetical protein DRO96_02140 [Candidatus Aenigmarchaeota archaeon]